MLCESKWLAVLGSNDIFVDRSVIYSNYLEYIHSERGNTCKMIFMFKRIAVITIFLIPQSQSVYPAYSPPVSPPTAPAPPLSSSESADPSPDDPPTYPSDDNDINEWIYYVLASMGASAAFIAFCMFFNSYAQNDFC